MSSMRIPSSPDAVHSAIEEILSGLGDGLTTEAYYDLKLILSELFVNAMIHGNKSDPARNISVEYFFRHGKVRLTITDEGGGFDPAGVCDPLAADNILKISGRGLFLVRSLADSLEFNETGNSVTVEKDLSAGER